MSGKPEFGSFLHRRSQGLSKGDPVAEPLVMTSMYHLPGSPEGYPGYGRIDNPTRSHLEDALSFLEGASVLAFPSGMAAISAALFATVKAGSKVLIPSDGYYVTRRLADEFLVPLGVTVEERATSTFLHGGFEGFDVVFVETPSNPGLDVLDLVKVVEYARTAGAITIADNTTLTPLGQRPLDLGVDMVVASDTKAMGGHSDILMGHVATRDEELLQRVRDWRNVSGTIPGPHDCWLLMRGLETLEVRFERMCASAEVVAARLQARMPKGTVRFPGLESDRSYEVAAKQMLCFGFVIGLAFGSEAQAEDFINGCPLLRPATSFGGTHSSAERRARWGDAVAQGYVRISVGCEPVEELWSAIDEAISVIV